MSVIFLAVKMKADAISNRPSSGRKSRLRYLDLSFEGKELAFKNGDMDNGRLPHGGYRGKSCVALVLLLRWLALG